VTVGAHQAHLVNGVACATCHVVPPAGDRTHAAGPTATVVFSGNRVGANGIPVAPWNRDQPTCANYCHAPAMGGAVPKPLWTRTTPLDCAACHWDQQTALTSTGLHVFHVSDLPVATRLDCGACHGDGYAKAGVTGAAQATHADGLVQTLPAVGWQDSRCVGPRTCFATCHTVCRSWP
jgi:predicted CxxxxCH...CXXCH cytochrome family protein